MQQSFLAHYALILIDKLGYAGLGLGLALNAAGIPLPSEVLLPIGGLAVKKGDLSLAGLLLLAVGAQLFGALVSRWIGQRGGIPLLKRYGRYVLLSERELDWAHAWFGRYGRWAAMIGYCLPLVRGYIGYAAGVAEMPVSSFALSAAIGILVWTAAMVTLGYQLADNLAAIEAVMKPFTYGIAALVVIVLAWAVWSRLKGGRTA